MGRSSYSAPEMTGEKTSAEILNACVRSLQESYPGLVRERCVGIQIRGYMGVSSKIAK